MRAGLLLQGIFFGLGQMQGLGLQHLRGMGFVMAKLEAPDGLPVFSGPSYVEIASMRAGVGAGQRPGLLAACAIYTVAVPINGWLTLLAVKWLLLPTAFFWPASMCACNWSHVVQHRGTSVPAELLKSNPLMTMAISSQALQLTCHQCVKCLGAGRVKTEIVHFLANTFTLHKFRDQRQVLGSELVLTDFDEAEMSVQSVQDFMAQAQADNKSPAAISLRAREGTTFNLMRLYGEA